MQVIFFTDILMSLQAILAKRERRQWEPAEKSWNDEALQIPWEEVSPPLHERTIFSLKNIFFFSHATQVQGPTLAKLRNPGSSAIIEAPTGSGKTLAFLLPLMERTIRWGEAKALVEERPPLSRRILGVILSPSRILAEQTYVVGKRLAARYPFNVQFALCDGVMETGNSCYEHLKRCSRGIGSFLVTTPHDLNAFLLAMESSIEHDPDNKVYVENTEEKVKDSQTLTELHGVGRKRKRQHNFMEDEGVHFFSAPDFRFLFILDEADLIFRYKEMKNSVIQFVNKYLSQKSFVEGDQQHRFCAQDKKLLMDFFCIGATVSVSHELKVFCKKMCAMAKSTLHTIQVKEEKEFVQQLNNRYIICSSTSFLPYLIHMLNMHSSRKHFVFFNNYHTLLLVKQLFQKVTDGIRPILFVRSIFTLHEEMSENQRLQQYNAFLNYRSSESKPKESAYSTSSSDGLKNSFFQGGNKRCGTPQAGTGAVLLCTDIAAFGLDVRDVDYVYHFEPPSSVKKYVHRVGRVGRMGMKGTSILMLPFDENELTVDKIDENTAASPSFDTVPKGKLSTSKLNSSFFTLGDLSTTQQEYVKKLSKRVPLAEYVLSPAAPISSTLRNIIQSDKQVLKAARSAAMSMCVNSDTDDKYCWFYPRLAINSLLLN